MRHIFRFLVVNRRRQCCVFLLRWLEFRFLLRGSDFVSRMLNKGSANRKALPYRRFYLFGDPFFCVPSRILCTFFICIILGVPFFLKVLPQATVLLIYFREVTVQISRRSTTTLTTPHRVLSQSLPTPGISKTTSIAKFYILLTVHLDTSFCIENQLDATFILSLFLQSTSTCFEHICSPSSGGIVYIYKNWYVFGLPL
jgi:hypothetical protein